MPKYVRWLALLFATLLVIVGIAAFNSQKAHAAEVQAAPQMQTAVHIEHVVPKSLAAPGGVAKSAPQFFSGGGVKPFWYYLPSNYCYWAMNGGYYCYRYGCTNFERWFYNCYDGYVRMNTYTWV